MAVFEIGMKTAQAIMSVWADSSLSTVAKLPMSILVATQGAMQLAALLSKPLPAYEKGTPKEGHGGGLALVGEKRRELVITPSGQMFYTPNKPTIMDLPRDSHVIPNPDAMSEMAKIDAINGLKNINFGGGFDVSGLRFDIKDLKRAILNKPEVGYDFDKGLKYIKRGGNKDYFVNRL